MTIAAHIVSSLESVLLSVDSWLSAPDVVVVESSAAAVSAHPLRLSVEIISIMMEKMHFLIFFFLCQLRAGSQDSRLEPPKQLV